MNTAMIGSGYGAASAYYVRKGEEERALETLTTGLKYAPANLELLRKKKLLESDTW